MAKNKIVTSSMAVALAMCSVSGSFAETVEVQKEPTPPVLEVKTEDGLDSPELDGTEGDVGKDIEGGVKPEDGGVKPEDGEVKPEDGEVKPEDGKPKPDDIKPESDKGMVDKGDYYDNTNIAVKGGIYLYVEHIFGNTSANFKDIVPTMVFELLDANGKSLGTATASSANYKKGEGYSLHFPNVPEYRKGDKFHLRLKSSDAIVKGVDITYVDKYTEEDKDEDGRYDLDFKSSTITNGKDVLFTGGIESGKAPKDGKMVQEVQGSKNAPLVATMRTDSSKVGVKIVDEKGSPVSGKKFDIERTRDKSTFSATTDNKGVLWLDRAKVEPVIEVTSTDSKYEFDGWGGKSEIILPITSTQQKLDDFLSTTIVLKEVVENEGGIGLGKITTSMNIKGSIDISDRWANVDLELKDTKTGATFDYTVNKDTKALEGIVDGTYIVTVKSSEAKVEVAKQVTVKNGKGDLKLTVSPNHVLEVTKRVDGKNTKYDFSVINVNDKKYSGSKATYFGVSPGETFMVKDNETEEVFNVTIDSKIGTTKVILGEGLIISADGTSPHTRDMGPMYVGVLGGSLLMAGLVAYKMSDDKRRALRSLMMVTVVAGSMMATAPGVFAGAGGDGSTSDGGNGSLKNVLNTTNMKGGTHTVGGEVVKQVVQFGFVPTRHLRADGSSVGNLTENGTEQQLADSKKFDADSMMYALYMPLNNGTATDFKASGVLDFNASSKKYSLLWGNNRLYGKLNNIEGKSAYIGDLQKRILSPPSSAMSSSNVMLKTMGTVLKPAQDNASGIYAVEYGETLNSKILSMSEADKNAFFDAYVQILKEKGVSDSALTKLREDYNKGQVSFVAQTLMRVQRGSDKANGMYMPVTSLSRALGVGQGKPASVYTREKRYLDTNKIGYCDMGRWCTATCASLNHPSYGTWAYTQAGYVRTIQAKTEPTKTKLPPNQQVKKGIFGGWGFFHWKDEKPANAQPVLTVKTVVDLYDDNGKVGVYKETSKIENTYFRDIFKKYAGYTKPFKLVNSVINVDGKLYEVIARDKNKTEMKDIKDNVSLYAPTLDLKTEPKPSIDIPVTSNGYGQPVMAKLTNILDPHSADDYNKHLGGESDKQTGNDANDDFVDDSNVNNDFEGGGEGGVVSPTKVVDKYKGKEDKDGKKEYSNAEATVYLEATFIGFAETVGDGPFENYEVPQWRLSRYWDDLLGDPQYASYDLVIKDTDDKGSHATSTVVVEGPTQMKLKPVDVGKYPWLKTTPKWKGPNTGYIGHSGGYFRTPIGGNLLATRTTKDIDTINFANWKGKGYTNEISSADKGNTSYKYKDKVTKSSTLKYYMEDPKIYTHNRSVYSHSSLNVGTKEEPDYIDVCNCHTVAESVPKGKYYPATYNFTTSYYRHHPKAISTVKINGEKGKSDGFSWESKQQPTLKLFPEIAMANSDISGRNNVSIVAGDLHREVTPLSYHFLELDSEIGSKVVGASVATDVKAQSLVQNVVNNSGGATVVPGGAQVIHKGSATNTSYTLKGTPNGIKQDKATLTAKTFALDIGNTALKNSWNTGTTYNTDKMNSDYLGQFGTKEGTNWKFTAKFQPGLKVGANEYKGKAESKPISGIPQATKEYSLVVRSGKLTLVSNKKPTAVTEELKLALDRMKLQGSDKTVLDVFEYNKGNKLTEAEVVSLMNAVRGTNEIKKDGNWYHEDTTVLVIREYTTVFDLPSAYMYSDKLQMQIPGLETPGDKNQFYNKGLAGHTTLEIGVDKSDISLKYDSSVGKWSNGNKKEMQYVVPNVSILDTSR